MGRFTLKGPLNVHLGLKFNFQFRPICRLIMKIYDGTFHSLKYWSLMRSGNPFFSFFNIHYIFYILINMYYSFSLPKRLQYLKKTHREVKSLQINAYQPGKQCVTKFFISRSAIFFLIPERTLVKMQHFWLDKNKK